MAQWPCILIIVERYRRSKGLIHFTQENIYLLHFSCISHVVHIYYTCSTYCPTETIGGTSKKLGCRIFYMAKLNLENYSEKELCDLVESRWKSSEELWDTVDKVTRQNQALYENRSEWLANIPERRRRWQVQANR